MKNSPDKFQKNLRLLWIENPGLLVNKMKILLLGAGFQNHPHTVVIEDDRGTYSKTKKTKNCAPT